MKKTMYIKPQVTVRHIDMPLMVIAASQRIEEGTRSIAPDGGPEIENESDFI